MTPEIFLKDFIDLKITSCGHYKLLDVNKNMFIFDKFLYLIYENLSLKILFSSSNVTYEIKFIFSDEEMLEKFKDCFLQGNYK